MKMNTKVKSYINALSLSTIAGLLISIGCCVNISTGGVIGAGLFSIALITIIYFGLPLFTGIVSNDIDTLMLVVLVGNAVGAILGGLLFVPTPIVNPFDSMSLMDILIGGCGTGVLMVAAYRSKNIIIAIMGVMVFILCGWPHCIAEMAYMRMSMSQWIMALLGNIIGGQVWRLLRVCE